MWSGAMLEEAVRVTCLQPDRTESRKNTGAGISQAKFVRYNTIIKLSKIKILEKSSLSHLHKGDETF